MTFGEYIRKRRRELDLTQSDIPGFSRSYIANIEGGRKRPTDKDMIRKLVRGLKLSEDQVTWLWVYSLLNEEPRAFFARSGLNNKKSREYKGQPFKEASAMYAPDNNIHKISKGESPTDIQVKLGDPDERLYFENRRKWYYDHLGIRILFKDDQVVDVEFK